MERRRVAFTMIQCWHRIPGGTALSIVELARALSARDDVDVIGVGPGGTRLPAEPFTPPVPLVRYHLSPPFIYDMWHRLRIGSPERLVTGTDVVHATGPTVPPVGKVPLVVTIHDLFPLHQPEQFTGRGVAVMTRGIEAARRNAAIVCCPSTDTLSDCVAAGFDEDRLRLVPWGVVPHDVSDEQRDAVMERYRLEPGYILWVGTVEPRKNLATLLDAYRAAGDLGRDLVLVGPVGWKTQLDGHLDGISRRVRHLGFVPPEHLPALYSEAGLFCFPSLREGFGLPALEAMAAGTPVIAASGGAVAEVLGGTGVTIDATDVDAWAQAIVELAGDASRRDTMAEAGRARASGYTWEAAAAATAAVYAEATA